MKTRDKAVVFLATGLLAPRTEEETEAVYCLAEELLGRKVLTPDLNESKLRTLALPEYLKLLEREIQKVREEIDRT